MKYSPLLLVILLFSCETKFEIETAGTKQAVPSKEKYSIQFSSQAEGNSELRIEDKGDSAILTIQVKNQKLANTQSGGSYLYQQKLSEQSKENWKQYLDSILSVELIDTGINVQNGLDVSFERNDARGKLFMAVGQVRDENGWYFKSSQAVLSKLQGSINDPVLAHYFQSLHGYYKDSSQNNLKSATEEQKESENSSSKTRRVASKTF